MLVSNLQKQWFRDVLQRFRKFHKKKTHVLEPLFDKVTGSQACNFIKKRLLRKCFPVKFAKFLRTLFLENISGGCF